MVSELLDFLNWRNTGLIKKLYDRYIHMLYNMLAYFLIYSVRSNSTNGRILLRNIGNLPEDMLMRILTAPQTFSVLSKFNSVHDPSSFFCESIEAELCRKGSKKASHNIWSALGD